MKLLMNKNRKIKMERLKRTFTCLILLPSLLGISHILVSCQQPANKQKPSGSADSHGTAPDKKSHDTVALNPVSRNDPNSQNARMLSAFDQKPDGNPGLVPGTKLNPIQKKAQELYLEGLKKAKDGDEDGAIASYTQSLNMYKNPYTYLKRATSEMVKQDYNSALNDMNEAMRINPKLDKAYLGRGICRFELKDYENAEADLKQYIELDKTTPVAYNYLAGCRYMKQDFKGALENYKMVAKLDPNYQDIYTNMGMMKHYLKDLKGAVEDYDKALTIEPDNFTAYNNRGGAKLTLGNMKGALEDFNKAIELSKDYADAYINRGKAKFSLDDLAGACEDWQKAYSLGIESAAELINEYCK